MLPDYYQRVLTFLIAFGTGVLSNFKQSWMHFAGNITPFLAEMGILLEEGLCRDVDR
jgi:hypothetical protein